MLQVEKIAKQFRKYRKMMKPVLDWLESGAVGQPYDFNMRAFYRAGDVIAGRRPTVCIAGAFIKMHQDLPEFEDLDMNDTYAAIEQKFHHLDPDFLRAIIFMMNESITTKQAAKALRKAMAYGDTTFKAPYNFWSHVKSGKRLRPLFS